MNTREEMELDAALTELRKGRITHIEGPAAWQVIHRHITGKQDNYLVFKRKDVQKLIKNAPELTTVEIRGISREELARPNEGDESI